MIWTNLDYLRCDATRVSSIHLGSCHMWTHDMKKTISINSLTIQCIKKMFHWKTKVNLSHVLFTLLELDNMEKSGIRASKHPIVTKLQRITGFVSPGISNWDAFAALLLPLSRVKESCLARAVTDSPSLNNYDWPYFLIAWHLHTESYVSLAMIVKLMQYSNVVSKCIKLFKRNTSKNMLNRNFEPSDEFHRTLKTSTTSGCLLCSFENRFPKSNIEVKVHAKFMVILCLSPTLCTSTHALLHKIERNSMMPLDSLSL